MRIKDISFKHHRVLGSTTIELSPTLKRSESREGVGHDDMDIAIASSENNTYTYLIGDNGVGKTVLFKSIVDYSNSFIWNKNSNVDQYYSLIDDGQLALRRSRGFNELFYDFNILNFIEAKNFLERHNMFLVHVSSAINEDERELCGESTRYFKVNYADRLQTKRMLVKAIRQNSDDALSLLSKHLGKENAKWELAVSISCIAWSKEQKIIPITEGYTIFDFFALFRELNKHGSVVSNMDKSYMSLLKRLLSTKSIKEYVLSRGESVFDLLKNFGLSPFYKSIEKFMKLMGYSQYALANHLHQAFGLSLDSSEDKPPIIDDVNIKQLSDIEFTMLLALMELNMLDCVIEHDGVLIDRMSSGEQMLIRLFGIFACLPSNFERENLLVLFDEPENSLHPKWQQSFPDLFKTIVEKVYKIRSSHFVFATHSPLIVMKSKIGNDNAYVIKLYKDDDGNTMSEQISDIHSYSVEELLMDEFSLQYRSDPIESKLKEILDSENARRLDDRSGCIVDYDSLRSQIDELYNQVISDRG